MIRASAESVSSVAGGFYDAAYGAGAWTDALTGLTRLFHGSRSWLFHSTQDAVEGHTDVADEGFHTSEAKAAITRDPIFLRTRSLVPGTLGLYSEIEDLTDFRRRELWQEWMRPRDLFFGMQVPLRVSGDSHFYLDLNRGDGQEDFTEDDKALMRIIAPHIKRAGDISVIVGGRSPASDLFARLPVAAVIVDRSLRVVDMNGAAVSLLERCVGVLGILGGMLDVAGDAASQQIRLLVANCVSPLTAMPADVVLLSGPQEGSGAVARLVVSAARLTSPEAFGLPGDPLAVIFLRGAVGVDDTALDGVLMSLFRLTPSQAKLARVLASGKPLRQAAAERGITYATARTYLEEIQRRTCTRRQAELVALLRSIEPTHLL